VECSSIILLGKDQENSWLWYSGSNPVLPFGELSQSQDLIGPFPGGLKFSSIHVFIGRSLQVCKSELGIQGEESGSKGLAA
jgi:hypothetical protein